MPFQSNNQADRSTPSTTEVVIIITFRAAEMQVNKPSIVGVGLVRGLAGECDVCTLSFLVDFETGGGWCR